MSALHRIGLAVLLVAGCRVDPPRPPSPSAPSCETACARGRSLHCDWSDTTPAGRTCEDVCRALVELQPVDLTCLSTIVTCDEEARCAR